MQGKLPSTDTSARCCLCSTQQPTRRLRALWSSEPSNNAPSHRGHASWFADADDGGGDGLDACGSARPTGNSVIEQRHSRHVYG
jgi:hypothetical protein